MVGIDFGKPLFTSEEIQRKIQELGARISTDYADKDLLVVGVLKGALFFMSDLLRSLRISVCMDFMHCTSSSSKGKDGTRSDAGDMKEDIKGKHVLLVEDIMDSGVTRRLSQKNAAGPRAGIAQGLRAPGQAGPAARCRSRRTTPASASRTSMWSATALITRTATGTCPISPCSRWRSVRG